MDNLKGVITWLVRGIIIGGIGLGVWTAQRLVGTLDAQGVKVDLLVTETQLQTSNLRSLQTVIDLGRRARDTQFNDLKSALTDHEGRIRTLERPNGGKL